jgi:hypothetical protein
MKENSNDFYYASLYFQQDRLCGSLRNSLRFSAVKKI